MSYASDTSVPVDRSKTEIERTLVRYGADGFGYGVQEKQAIIMFSMQKRKIRFHLPLPNVEDFSTTDKGRSRKPGAMQEAMEQELRRRWRALSLVVKAKLESVSSGIATFDDEFMAYVVLPGGQTVSEQVTPFIEKAYATGKVGPLLLEFAK
jgi:hypothetical protein